MIGHTSRGKPVNSIRPKTPNDAPPTTYCCQYSNEQSEKVSVRSKSQRLTAITLPTAMTRSFIVKTNRPQSGYIEYGSTHIGVSGMHSTIAVSPTRTEVESFESPPLPLPPPPDAEAAGAVVGVFGPGEI